MNELKPKIRRMVVFAPVCPKCGSCLSNGEFEENFETTKKCKDALAELVFHCDGMGCDYEWEGGG